MNKAPNAGFYLSAAICIFLLIFIIIGIGTFYDYVSNPDIDNHQVIDRFEDIECEVLSEDELNEGRGI